MSRRLCLNIPTAFLVYSQAPESLLIFNSVYFILSPKNLQRDTEAKSVNCTLGIRNSSFFPQKILKKYCLFKNSNQEASLSDIFSQFDPSSTFLKRLKMLYSKHFFLLNATSFASISLLSLFSYKAIYMKMAS